MSFFAAAFPFPVLPPAPLPIPHSRTRSAVAGAMLVSSFVAHLRRSSSPEISEANKVPRASGESELVMVADLVECVNGLLRLDELAKIARERPLVERLSGLLPIHQPEQAGGHWCVSASEVAALVNSTLCASEFAETHLLFADLSLDKSWRPVVDLQGRRHTFAPTDGHVWLSLTELVAVLPFLRGRQGLLLRRAINPPLPLVA